MTAPAFLQTARDVDASIQEQDRLILRATVQQVHPRLIWRAVECRNDLVREWAQLSGMRVVGR